jgi:hypothetical protein
MLNTEPSDSHHALVYHVLRYASNLIRDEWVNIGVLLFDPLTGNLRIRMVENQDEYARIRRLHPKADEDAIRQLHGHLEDRFDTFLRNNRAEEETPLSPGEAVQASACLARRRTVNCWLIPRIASPSDLHFHRNSRQSRISNYNRSKTNGIDSFEIRCVTRESNRWTWVRSPPGCRS